MSDLMAALEAALSQNADAWTEAPAETGSIYDPPPEGEYEALVSGFEFIQWDAKSADKPAGVALKVTYQVTNHSTYSGRVTSDMFTLTVPERLKWLKGWLNTMGVNVENMALTDLRPVDTGDGLLDKLLDTPVLIYVKHKVVNGERRVNTYLRQVLGEWGAGTAQPRSDITTQQTFDDFAPQQGSNAVHQGAKDDDIPF